MALSPEQTQLYLSLFRKMMPAMIQQAKPQNPDDFWKGLEAATVLLGSRVTLDEEHELTAHSVIAMNKLHGSN